MKNLVKIIGLSAVAATVVYGSAYKLPEQSAQSVALSGAYVANSSGAGAAYYNPANMSFNKNQTDMELSLMSIGLSKIKYEDNRADTMSGESKAENFIVPTIFISTKDYSDSGLRYGLSIVVPGGLSKRWDDSFPKTFAEEFTLEIVEINPVVSYKINEQFSIGGGVRVVKSEGVVKSDGNIAAAGGVLQRDLTGDSIDYGYNLGVAYKPDETSNISVTYRSNVDITIEGDATLTHATAGLKHESGASVTVPLPATSTLAYSKTFASTTVELNYEKTYWSAYEELDFEYDKEFNTGSSAVNGAFKAVFDDPIDKSWKDTTAYRIGVTHKLNEKLTLMAGYAKDENPVPEKTLGYELPDSDATLYSIGANYVIDDKSSVGFGYLLDIKDKRTVKNDTIDGEFTDATAHLISFAYRTSF